MRKLATAASSRAMILPSPTLRSAPMRGGGFGVEGIAKPVLQNLDRWFRAISRAGGVPTVHRAADVVAGQ